jgi:succinate-semialdehyde dehydrogenase/glutarate-semialdehyde dehydrogenase
MTRYATVDPTTGTTVREFETMSEVAVDVALDRALDAYSRWSTTEVAHRAGILKAVAQTYRERADELAALMALEMGKPVAQSRGEIELSASIYHYYATSGPKLLADEVLDISGAGQAVVRTTPIGPLLGIMPWNYPHYQVARFVAPNLLLGNTLLLKHAGSCPQQALRIEAMLLEAGVPDGVYQNVFATTDQVARMIASPALRGVSLTGSERAGSAVGTLAGRHLKKCVLELGGSDAFIVLPDADLPAAAAAAATGRFANAGQACTSSKRMIVSTQVWDEFVALFLEQASRWTMGDPMADGTRLGPMASTSARDDLAAQVQDAMDLGATVLLGGTVPDAAGAWYPATVLCDVTPAMRAYREELFGPVAVLHRVETLNDAVELANDSPYGLGSAVFSENVDTLSYVADRLDVGMVGFNTTIKSAPDLPFGGVKSSGFGRELGKFGLDEFANKKLLRSV